MFLDGAIQTGASLRRVSGSERWGSSARRATSSCPCPLEVGVISMHQWWRPFGSGWIHCGSVDLEIFPCGTETKTEHMGMGQYLYTPFLVGWTSIYQLFWGSLGTRVLTHIHIITWLVQEPCSNQDVFNVFPSRTDGFTLSRWRSTRPWSMRRQPSTTRNCWRTMVPGLELGRGSANISTAKPPWRDGLGGMGWISLHIFAWFWWFVGILFSCDSFLVQFRSHIKPEIPPFLPVISGSCWIHKPIFSGQKWSKHLKLHQHEHC